MKDVDDIQYQGRAARRDGSEQRRQAILEASLRIIVKEGVRAVRHRAVAREADVPLSATTYYFKDIPDLIVDTFTLFAERAMRNVVAPFQEQAFHLLEAHQKSNRTTADREQLLDDLSELIGAFIRREATEQYDHLVAERAFFTEATIEPRLAKLAMLYVDTHRKAASEGCLLLGSKEPVEDGEILLSVMYRLEQQLLMASDFPQAKVESRLRRTLDLIIPAMLG